MSQQQFDVAGLGNAIVDIIASVDDRFLLTHRIAKGGMALVDEFRAKELLRALADGSQALINYVRENARVPIIETGAGVVHTFFDATGDLASGAGIIANAKKEKEESK